MKPPFNHLFRDVIETILLGLILAVAVGVIAHGCEYLEKENRIERIRNAMQQE